MKFISRASLVLVLLVLASAQTWSEDSFTAPIEAFNSTNDPTTYAALQAEVLTAVGKLYEEYLPMAKLKGPKLLEAKAKYDASAKEFAQEWFPKGIGVLLRVPEQHLLPVFRAGLAGDDWFVKFRTLRWLADMRDAESADSFVAALSDSNSLVRETAAIGLCLVIDPKTYKGKYAAKIAECAKKEENKFVCAALSASVALLEKKSLPEAIWERFASGKPGMTVQPYVNGFAIPAGYVEKQYSKDGKAAIQVALEWGYPVSGFHRKIIPGVSSVPFGALKTPTVFHLGEDVAWLEEGAGVFAIADGCVRHVQHYGDWGGLIIVEHRISEKESCCALYGHCGKNIFAKVGEVVKKGQLLGTMGLSFSLENGGHAAHSHFGMFKGTFAAEKCVGYRNSAAGKEDFLDPFQFLDERVNAK
ncbi:MAG: peptidoglycan DD-metalloendopeptidase family protein [Candidatus Brocadiia bacterium]